MTRPTTHREGRLIGMGHVHKLLRALAVEPRTIYEIEAIIEVKSLNTVFALFRGMRRHLEVEIERSARPVEGKFRYSVRSWGVLDRRAFVPAPKVAMGSCYVMGCEDDCAPD